MIRSLRRRFILIAMLSLVCTLLLLGGAINVIYRHISTSQADTVIDLLYYNGGSFPAPYENPDPISGQGFQVTPETSFETRYVIVSLSDNMEVTYIDLDHIAAIDRRAVADILGNILDSGKSSGYSGQYRYVLIRISLLSRCYRS